MTESRHGRGVSGGRSLKTAAEALAALRFLGAAEEGATAEALAGELGKSTATARYLLNTLCQEGFAVRDGRTGTFRLTETPPWGDAWGDGGDAGAPHDLTLHQRFCLVPIHAPEGRVAAGIAISPPARRVAPHAAESTGGVRDVARTTARGWQESDLPPPLPADPVPPGY